MADEAVKFGLTREIEGVTDRKEKKIHGVTMATVHQQHRLHRRGACAADAAVAAWL